MALKRSSRSWTRSAKGSMLNLAEMLVQHCSSQFKAVSGLFALAAGPQPEVLHGFRQRVPTQHHLTTELPLSDLMAYFDAVRLVTRRYLDQATDNDLSRVYHYRGGDRSGTWILGHILVEESQHTGQVAMIRGMMRGLGA